MNITGVDPCDHIWWKIEPPLPGPKPSFEFLYLHFIMFRKQLKVLCLTTVHRLYKTFDDVKD